MTDTARPNTKRPSVEREASERDARTAAIRQKYDAKYADVPSLNREAFWDRRLAKVYHEAKRRERSSDPRRWRAVFDAALTRRLPSGLSQLLRPAERRRLGTDLLAVYGQAAGEMDFGRQVRARLFAFATADHAVEMALRGDELRARDTGVPASRRFRQ